MIENIIWLALGLLVIASLIPQHNKMKLPLAGISWMFFSIHWMLQWRHYYELEDYVNVFLTIFAAVFSIFIGYIMIKKDKRLLQEYQWNRHTDFYFNDDHSCRNRRYFLFSLLRDHLQ